MEHTAATEEFTPLASTARGGPWSQAAHRLVHKKVAFAALIVIIIIYGAGILAPWVTTEDYRATPSTELELPGFPSIALSPLWPSDQTLFNHTPVGIFRSEDSGNSWITANEGLGANNVDALAFSPTSEDGLTLFAGTPKGLFRSTDSGDSWEAASQGLPPEANVNQIAVSPAFQQDKTLYAALSGGVYRSTNGGDSWLKLNNGFESLSPTVYDIALSPNFLQDHTLFISASERKAGSFQSYEGLFRSTDGGDSWIPTYKADISISRAISLAIPPQFSSRGTVFASSSRGLLRSIDGGLNWEVINPTLSSTQVLDLILSPAFHQDQTLFVVTQTMGLFRSTDGGDSWESANKGLSVPRVVSASLSPDFGKDRTVFAGTGDNCLFRSKDTGSSWSLVACKDLKQGPSILNWPPNLDHPFGTDRLGRDMYTRIVYGIRTTVIITLASVLTGSLLLGLVLGGAAGYFGGKVDSAIMRIGEIFLAFPGILLIILIAATVKPRAVEWVRDFESWSGIDGIVRSGAVDYFVVFAALTLFSWVGMARLVRGQILYLKESQYVDAAQAMGASNKRIIFRHLLPNAISPVIVSVSMGMGSVAGSEVILSWLGIGIQPPNPSLGRMIFENFGLGNLSILRNDPHLILLPVLTIAIIIFAWNLLGDGLNDVLNPRTR